MSASTAPNRLEDLAVEIATNEGRALVTVRGELDLLTAQQLAAKLVEAERAASDLLIDLSDLTFLDVAGTHVLRDACARNGTRIVCPPGNPRRVLELLSFGDVGLLHDSVEEAWGSEFAWGDR